MTGFGRVYVDANIVIKLYEGSPAERNLLASIIVRADNSVKTRFVTSELSRAEVLPHPIRNRDNRLLALYDSLLIDGGMLIIAPFDAAIANVSAAMRAEKPGLKLPDAIHMATALNSGCERFLTADLRITGSIKLPPDPLRNVRGYGYDTNSSLQILRPDPETLTSLLAEFTP